MRAYLRRWNTNEQGKVAAGYRGLVSDVVEQAPAPVDACVWVPATKGKAGRECVHTFQCFFCAWVNEGHPEDKAPLHGGTITGAGCRPIVGARDPLSGMRGPIWDLYITITLVSVGESEWDIYVHRSADG